METQWRLHQVLQAGLDYIENMELETICIDLIFFLMIPFIMGSVWSVGITVAWQLFMLGLKAGVILFILCTIYMTYLRGKRMFVWRKRIQPMMWFGGNLPEGSAEDYKKSKPICTLLDTMLSVYFQTGLGFPAGLWDAIMDVIPASSEEVKTNQEGIVKPKKRLITRTPAEALAYCLLEQAETDEVDSEEGSQSQSEDAGIDTDMDIPTARIVERMLLDATTQDEASSPSRTVVTKTGRRRRTARTGAGKPKRTKGAARL